MRKNTKMAQVKFNGETYDVKPTGKQTIKPAKSYTDFNGYEVSQERSVIKQQGMYNSDGVHVANISRDGKIIKNGKVVGSGKVKR